MSSGTPNSGSQGISFGDQMKAELLAHLGGPYQPALVVTVQTQSAPLASTGGVSSSPAAATSSAPITATIKALAIQPYGCAVEELELQAPHLSQTSMDVLKKWANSLCQKITYLLESIGPLEFDVDGQEVLIRSMPPSPHPTSKRYYEIRLSTLGSGRFLLARYEAMPGQPRTRQPLELGMEQIVRLGNDLMATLPAHA